MVLIELDGDSILVEAIQNQLSGEMARACQTLVDQLKEYGIEPKMHILVNECSNELKSRQKVIIWTTNLCPLTITGEILRRKQFKWGKHITLVC